MSNPSLASSIPGLVQLASFKRIDDDSVERFKCGTGPDKTRRISTKSSTVYEIPVEINGADLALFQTFYEDTLENGTLPFDWVDPITDVAATFVFKSRPQWVNSLAGIDTTKRWYQATLVVEVQ